MFVPCAAIQQLLLLSHPPTTLSILPKPPENFPGSKYSLWSFFQMKCLLDSIPPVLILSISAAGWVTLGSSGSLWVVVGAPARGFREPAV